MAHLAALAQTRTLYAAEANTAGTLGLFFAIVLILVLSAARMRVPTRAASIGVGLTIAALLALGRWRDAAGHGGLGAIGRVKTGRGWDGHGSAPISSGTVTFALLVFLGLAAAFFLGILHTRRRRAPRSQVRPWIATCTVVIVSAVWFLGFDRITRLHLTARRGWPDAAARLLSSDPSLANAVHFHRTPLWNAALGGSAEVVEHLVRAGADPGARTFVPSKAGSDDPVLRAIESGHAEAARAILRAESGAGIEPNPTRLAWAAREGHAAGIAPLVEGGIPVDWPFRGQDGEVPALTLADNTEVVRALLQQGADARLGAPLHAAVRHGPESVQLLLAAGADVDTLDCRGRTALGLAPHEPAHLLLTHGASLELGHPLHTAALFRNTGTVKLLLEAGADPNALDEEGKRPIDYANVEVIRKLLHPPR